MTRTVQELAEETKGFVLDKFNTLDVRLNEIEQKSARPRSEDFEFKTYGEQLADNDRFKAWHGNSCQGSTRLELKAITTAAGSGGGVIYSQRDLDIASLPQRTVRVRDLLTVVPTNAGSVDYAKQTTRANAAAPVAEGLTKPYSNYGWTNQNLPMRTIAHLSKLTRQAMDDSAQLAGEVDNEMRFGLQLVEDAQLLYGDGTGQNLTGLMPNATPYALPTGFTLPSGANRIDQIGAAMLQVMLAEQPVDGVVLNPVDWMMMAMLKDAANGYLISNPLEGVGIPTIWGKPVAVTQAMAVGSFLVGGTKLQKLYDRLSPEVLLSSENVDDFEKNLLTMRAEQRLGLAIRQATALVKGTFA